MDENALFQSVDLPPDAGACGCPLFVDMGCYVSKNSQPQVPGPMSPV